MTRRFLIIASAIILIGALVGGTIGRSKRFRRSVPGNGVTTYTEADDIEKDYNEAVSEISSSYAGEIDYEKATQAAIQGMLSTLDPHSMYFPYNEFKKLKEDQDSRFYGIGVTIVQHRDGVYVQSAVEETPAARLGLRYGDRILEVDGKDARDWSSDWDDGHFVVLVAMDAQRLYAMDPSSDRGWSWLDLDEFVTRWHDYVKEGGRIVHLQHMAVFIAGKIGRAHV